MYPVVCQVVPECGFGLSHFVGVMGPDVVNTTGVDVDRIFEGGVNDG